MLADVARDGGRHLPVRFGNLAEASVGERGRDPEVLVTLEYAAAGAAGTETSRVASTAMDGEGTCTFIQLAVQVRVNPRKLWFRGRGG